MTRSDAIATNEPPPEAPASIRQRRLVILSFWLLAVFLGLPTWIWTTSVPRAQLPLQQMNDWADGSTCRLSIPVDVPVSASQMAGHEALQLVHLIQHALDDADDSAIHHLKLRLVEVINDDSSGLVLAADETSTTFHSKLDGAQIHVNFPPGAILAPHALSLFIANALLQTYAEEQTMLRRAIDRSAPKESVQPMKYGPLYHITLSLFTATALPSGWDIDEALNLWLQPVLRIMRPIGNFTVDTQVQLHARMASSVPPPQFDAVRNEYMLRQQDLGAFVNAAEWPLSPSIGPGPTIHFVVYVPDPRVSPLRIQDTDASSWIVPQWGSVSIMNSDKETLSANALQPALMTISRQLLGFMGLPSGSESFSLRLATLQRVRTVALMASAGSTMGSLARLTAALPSIAIPETVSRAVDDTLDHLKHSCLALRTGKPDMALHHAQLADDLAEKAFFEKSMVGQVYFPDEHKVAVYMPLLGPVGVPLITSALKEIRKIIALRRRAHS